MAARAGQPLAGHCRTQAARSSLGAANPSGAWKFFGRRAILRTC
ncbi:hypothetical protein NY78_2449 [Desulfovibrio sp. TomC]|nr:hypothetical protein NY78_2449 [Desulfovibrio sp. TomC]